jgi:hypothetical protein
LEDRAAQAKEIEFPMSKVLNEAAIMARRAELIAQLFFQEIGASFASVPSADIGYDFVVGFDNGQGGMNFSVVEVKSTERPQPKTYALSLGWFKRLAFTNVPSMLLVVDVKQNRLYCGWPDGQELAKHGGAETIRVPITEVDGAQKRVVRERLRGTATPPK